MNRRRPFTWLLIAGLAGCSPAQAPAAKPSPAAVEATARLDQELQEQVADFNRRTGARQISVSDVRARLDRGEKILFLDVREPVENAVSSLPEARLIPPGLVSSAKVEPPAGAAIVTYCTVGYRSGLAAVELEQRLGRPVFNLTGGIIAWFNAGGEVRDPEGKPASRIHPYSEEWAKYVHPRQAEEGSASSTQ